MANGKFTMKLLKPPYLDLDTGSRKKQKEDAGWPKRPAAGVSFPASAAGRPALPARSLAAVPQARYGGIWKAALLLLALGTAALAQAADINPLPPDTVYKVSASAAPGTISVHWDILPGYYLYKDKFKFISHITGIRLGEPQFPAGEQKQDPFFGKQTIYHKDVTVTVPYTGVGKLDLELVYQVCAEVGFCYPPQHKRVDLMLVAPSAATAVAGTSNKAAPNGAENRVSPPDLTALVPGSGASGGDDASTFPPPDQVFRYSATAKDANTLELRWGITPGFYLYRQKFDIKSDNPDVQLGQPDFPEGQIKNDPNFGTSEIYTQDLDVLVPVTVSNGASKFKLTVTYQGCAEAGLCYPPQTKTQDIDLSAAGAASATAGAPNAIQAVAEQDRLANLLATGNLFWVLLTFIGIGVLLAFTPCMLPMIPILSGIIIGQGKKLTTRRAFLLSLTYVLAMAATYALVGVVVGLLGANIQLALQNPWVLGAFAALFVALALSMFGLYELQMPSSVQTWLTQHSNAQKSGAFVGVAVMGVLSALIAGPCITAPLVAVLVFIGKSGSALRGGLALFAIGLGMGIPLLAIGTSAGRLVPKTGGWMNTVKHVFGVVMLGLAIWFLGRILPGPVTLALWAILAIVCGIYMGALEPGTQGWARLWRGLGFVSLLYGLILLLGAATGGDDAFRPLARLSVGSAMQTSAAPVAQALPFKRVKTSADLDAAIAAAGGKPVMLDFAADWCVSCKELERNTYTDPAVQAALKDVVLLQADVTANDDDDKALYARFGIFGPPGVMFFGHDGKELTSYRVVGYLGPDDFLKRVDGAFAKN
jgi:thiol:disulfide interchange protein DsbD